MEIKRRRNLTVAERIRYNDNLAVGINAINRGRFARGAQYRLYTLHKAEAFVKAIDRKQHIGLVEASKLFKEMAKDGQLQ